MFLPSLLVLAGAQLAFAKCKCTPVDDCWPSTSAWKSLNTTANGKLIYNQPIARPCYQGDSYSETQCQDIAANWITNSWIADFPTGFSYPTIERCPVVNATLGKDQYPQCDLGNYPVYTVNATGPEDIAATIKFAKDHNVRLTIKNTGHDISQRSQGYGSLSIWIKYIKNGLSYQPGYISVNGTCQSNYTGPAIKISGGYVWKDVYKFAYEHGSIVVGGGDPTVGAIGGYLQGGGHGPASHEFGLGADQVLEYQVVLASGELVTANACQYADLFTALRGGGGGTYGIVVSATVKAHPERPALGHQLTIAGLNANGTALMMNITGDMIGSVPQLVDEGFSGTALLTNGEGVLAYEHPLVKLLDNNSSATINKAKAVMSRNFVNKWARYNGTSLYVKSEWKLYNSFFEWYQSGSHITPGNNRPMMASRFFDKKSLETKKEQLPNLVKLLTADHNAQGEKLVSSFVLLLNLVAGGKVLEPQPLTGVNPAWRKTYLVAQQTQVWPENAGYEQIAEFKKDLTFNKLEAMKAFAPGMGTYGNEADPYDPDWKHDWWGSNYESLLTTKKKYDPESTFWCWRCVGNDGWAEVTGGTLYGPLCETK